LPSQSADFIQYEGPVGVVFSSDSEDEEEAFVEQEEEGGGEEKEGDRRRPEGQGGEEIQTGGEVEVAKVEEVELPPASPRELGHPHLQPQPATLSIEPEPQKQALQPQSATLSIESEPEPEQSHPQQQQPEPEPQQQSLQPQPAALPDESEPELQQQHLQSAIEDTSLAPLAESSASEGDVHDTEPQEHGEEIRVTLDREEEKGSEGDEPGIVPQESAVAEEGEKGETTQENAEEAAPVTSESGVLEESVSVGDGEGEDVEEEEAPPLLPPQDGVAVVHSVEDGGEGEGEGDGGEPNEGKEVHQQSAEGETESVSTKKMPAVADASCLKKAVVVVEIRETVKEDTGVGVGVVGAGGGEGDNKEGVTGVKKKKAKKKDSNKTSKQATGTTKRKKKKKVVKKKSNKEKPDSSASSPTCSPSKEGHEVEAGVPNGDKEDKEEIAAMDNSKEKEKTKKEKDREEGKPRKKTETGARGSGSDSEQQSKSASNGKGEGRAEYRVLSGEYLVVKPALPGGLPLLVASGERKTRERTSSLTTPDKKKRERPPIALVPKLAIGEEAASPSKNSNHHSGNSFLSLFLFLCFLFFSFFLFSFSFFFFLCLFLCFCFLSFFYLLRFL